MPRGELFPKLSSPVLPPAVSVVEAALDASKAKDAIEHLVRDGVLRPFDIASATVEEPRALWVPFWRVAVAVDGLHLDVTKLQVGRDGRSVPVPTGASRYRDAAVMIPARSDFPYAPRLPSLFSGLPGSAAALEVRPDELGASDVAEAMAGENAEILDADVRRDQAESTTLGLLLRAVGPAHAIYAKYEPRIEDARFCYYPVYHARYAYTGEARRRLGEEYFVAVSARTGQLLAARHPSAARAVAARVRRLLSFDTRR
jgi:hypothetical protein